MMHFAKYLFFPALLAAGAPDSIYDLATDDPELSTLVAAVDAAGLAGALSDPDTLTLFAPRNPAFAAIQDTVDKLLDPTWQPQLADLLSYHLLPSVVTSSDLVDGATATTLNGEDVVVRLDPARVNDAEIVAADAEAGNGVVHVVDAVLTPTSVTSSVVDLAIATPELSTLVEAVVAAGLAEALSAPGPYTVFAPTDAAFAALPEGVLDDLLKPENKDQLASILTYHVVGGNIPASMVSTGDVDTLNGEPLSILASGDGVEINHVADVINADNLANNGIVHIIDAVLLPPATSSSSGKSRKSKMSKSSKPKAGKKRDREPR